MDEIGEGGRLGYWGRGDRVQIGYDGFCVGVNARTSGQSGESALRVELEEAGLKVRAIHEVDGLELDVDTELSTEEAMSDVPPISLYRKILTRQLLQQQPRRNGRKCRELAAGKKDR